MGAVYVEVDASMVNNGIMTLSESGGQEPGSYWILWDVGGYTQSGWFWGETPVTGWWENVASEYGQEPTSAGLDAAITAGQIPNLDDALGSWDNASKLSFLQAHAEVFLNCMSPA